jgi:hypothetical protein
MGGGFSSNPMMGSTSGEVRRRISILTNQPKTSANTATANSSNNNTSNTAPSSAISNNDFFTVNPMDRLRNRMSNKSAIASMSPEVKLDVSLDNSELLFSEKNPMMRPTGSGGGGVAGQPAVSSGNRAVLLKNTIMTEDIVKEVMINLNSLEDLSPPAPVSSSSSASVPSVVGGVSVNPGKVSSVIATIERKQSIYNSPPPTVPIASCSFRVNGGKNDNINNNSNNNANKTTSSERKSNIPVSSSNSASSSNSLTPATKVKESTIPLRPSSSVSATSSFKPVNESTSITSPAPSAFSSGDVMTTPIAVDHASSAVTTGGRSSSPRGPSPSLLKPSEGSFRRSIEKLTKKISKGNVMEGEEKEKEKVEKKESTPVAVTKKEETRPSSLIVEEQPLSLTDNKEGDQPLSAKERLRRRMTANKPKTSSSSHSLISKSQSSDNSDPSLKRKSSQEKLSPKLSSFMIQTEVIPVSSPAFSSPSKSSPSSGGGLTNKFSFREDGSSGNSPSKTLKKTSSSSSLSPVNQKSPTVWK